MEGIVQVRGGSGVGEGLGGGDRQVLLFCALGSGGLYRIFFHKVGRVVRCGGSAGVGVGLVEELDELEAEAQETDAGLKRILSVVAR